MTDAVLCINSGSSTVKFSVYAVAPDGQFDALLCRGLAELKDRTVHLAARDAVGGVLTNQAIAGQDESEHEQLLGVALMWLEQHSGAIRLLAAGHRVVHGGERFVAPVRVTPEIVEFLETLVPLAPLHQPHNLAAIRALAATRPGLPQIACFDTAFHRTQPKVARQFALPGELTQQGIKRYGFHGLSYEYVAGVLPRHLGDRADGRVVVAHLGNGASLCALRQRKSIASTMGFTPLDGLIMGTRCGNLDPGVLLYLSSEHKMDVNALTDLLYHRCGLLGVSGISADMRTLLASPDPHAEEAVELFCYRISRELGSMAAALGGLDVLVFTGGIGEHAVEVRRRVCQAAQWLGVELDNDRNLAGKGCISTEQSRVAAWVIPTDEESVVARETLRHVSVESPAASNNVKNLAS